MKINILDNSNSLSAYSADTQDSEFYTEYSLSYKSIIENNYLFINSTVSNLTVRNEGWVFVENGGHVINSTLNNGGYMSADYGGKVEDITINQGGFLELFSEGIAENITLNGGQMYSDGVVNGLIIEDGGFAQIWGPELNDVTVKQGGYIEIVNDTAVKNITLEADSTYYFIIYGLTTMTGKYREQDFKITPLGRKTGILDVDKYCRIDVTGYCEMDNITVNTAGCLYITENAAVYNIVENGGYVVLDEGAKATFVPHLIKDLEIDRNVPATIHRNTSVRNVLNHSELYVFEGGFVTGELIFSHDETFAYFQDGSFFEFDLRERKPSNNAIINHYDYILGTPEYSITVNSDQTPGTYVLADFAQDFSTSISVKVGDSEEIYGTIKADGKEVVLNGTSYILFKKNNKLYFTVEEQDLPDLVVSAVPLADEVFIGDSTYIYLNVSNNGKKAAEASVLYIYQNNQIVHSINVPVLQNGETYTHVITFTPNESYIGNISFTAVADGEYAIKESDEDNNSVAFDIEVLERPDLTASISLSSEKIFRKESAICHFSVANEGGTDADNFYISVYANDVFVKNVFIKKLSAGSSYSESITLEGKDFAEGDSVITVIADSNNNVTESAENNNTASATLTVEEQPDWIISFFEISPEIIKEGEHSNIHIMVTNIGKKQSDATTLTVYFGNDIIEEFTVSPAQKGQSQSFTIPFDSSKLTWGRYFISATVDTHDAIKEENEYNNSASLIFNVTLPDLIVSEIKATKYILDKNDAVTISFTIKNIGDVQALNSYTLIEFADQKREDAVLNLFPGMEYNSFIVISSADFDAPGEYFVTVTADGRAEIKETAEYNNSATIRIIYDPKIDPDPDPEKPSGSEKLPDLIISQLIADPNQPANEKYFHFKYSVTNVGDINADASTLYIFVDNKKVGEINIPELEKGKTYYGDYTLDRKSLAYGKHTITLHADYEDVVTEIKEDNNTASLKFEKNFIIKDTNIGSRWESVSQEGYIVDYTQNQFMNCLRIYTPTNAVDLFGIPSGVYQWRIKEKNAVEWHHGRDINSSDTAEPPERFISDKDGDFDLFFANTATVWENSYSAQHQGVFNSWQGTQEKIVLKGKNRITDVFEGSSDANVLVLTDTENGDALFVDDIYSVLGSQARLKQIDEIRAGAGDDIIDFTSSQFEYVGNGTKIYGGIGNDVIWAGCGTNTLFGDSGNDQIIGGNEDDIIIGGIGNDTLHGGGGNDKFVFGGNFGNDTVEQLIGNKVTFYFESENVKYNETAKIFSDGINSVALKGDFDFEVIYLIDSSLAAIDAYDDFASEKIFEDKSLIA